MLTKNREPRSLPRHLPKHAKSAPLLMILSLFITQTLPRHSCSWNERYSEPLFPPWNGFVFCFEARRIPWPSYQKVVMYSHLSHTSPSVDVCPWPRKPE